MNKKIAFITLFSSIFALSIFKNKENIVKAEDANGFHLEQVFNDKFNKENLDPSWKLNGATLENNYNGLHCISPVPYGSGPIINGAKLSDKTQINFTIYPQSGQSESNISFNIGMATPSTPQKEPDVDCKVQFWNDQLVFTNWQNNLAVDHSMINEHVLRGFNGLFSSLLRTDISLIIERKSNTSTQIYAEYRRDGEIVYTNKGQPFTLVSPRNPYGYCGFFWDVVEMDVTNFEIYNNDKLVFKDEFEENTLTYPLTDYNLGNFHINSSLNESQCYYSMVSSVKMDGKDESIINENILSKLENVTNPYNLSYSIKVNTLEDNSFCGFGFGLGDDDNKIDAKNAIGFIKKDNQNAEVIALKDGKIDRSNNYQISLSKILNNKYNDYKISIDANNNVHFVVAGNTYKFANINCFGKSGIGIVDLGATSQSSIEMKQFSLSRNVYNKYDSEDASNNFQGRIVPDPTDPLYSEPYLNDQKYTLGTGVSLEEDWATGSQNLTFTNATPYSCFGYSKEYSEWICEFDVELYTFKQGHMFGIAFGKKSLFDVLIPASTSLKAYLLRCDVPNTAEITYGSGVSLDDNKTYRICNTNFFDENNNKYHMMFIGKNRNVYVYYKEIDEPDENLGILRATIPNVNVDGYVSIVGNNGISFGVNNFKMVNLSDECKKESNLTIRESFENNTISNQLVLDNKSKIEEGKLVLNNSNITTANENLYEIIRFSAYDFDKDFNISLSKNKKIIFDVANEQINIDETGEITSFDAKEMNFKYINGKRFEIIALGDQIKIGYKGFYDPIDKLSKPFITYTLKSPLEKDKISFSTTSNAKIDDLYIFSCDNSKTCENYDYEDDPNNDVIWKIKPDFDPSKVYKETNEDNNPEIPETQEKSGCKGGFNNSIFILFGSLMIALTIYRLKRRNI